MGLSRSALLWCSENRWMRKNVPNYSFVKKAVKRFMPGESVGDALQAVYNFEEKNIGTIFTRLGENISNLEEAGSVREHYIGVLKQISKQNLSTEISIKATQLGFDYSYQSTLKNVTEITSKAKTQNNFVWIDMEQSSYIDDTIRLYREVKSIYDNVGLCLQAYLFRTKKDLENLMEVSPNIRLVKGAYMEPAEIAFKKKKDVDENYFELMKYLLTTGLENNVRVAIATHDIDLINLIKKFALENSIDSSKLEFNMLFGIKSQEQFRLANKGNKISVLISYGEHWYPWYIRRLAERPANIGFVLRNMF